MQWRSGFPADLGDGGWVGVRDEDLDFRLGGVNGSESSHEIAEMAVFTMTGDFGDFGKPKSMTGRFGDGA